MKEDLSIFFQICKNPVLLNKFRDNDVIQEYCKIISDNFIAFPHYEIEDLKYHGYPNDEYLCARFKNFHKVMEKLQTADTETQIELIRSFLESCHGDDTTRDDKANIHEPEYLFYHSIFTKSNIIPLERIYKVFPELKKEVSSFKIPCLAFKVPVGTIIEIEHNNGVTRFNDIQDSKITLDFLRFPYSKNFRAKIVVSPKWFNYDTNYYKNRNAKWQELRIQGIKTEDIKIYILECSVKKSWLKELFENSGIKTITLSPFNITTDLEFREALIDCLVKEYRALLAGDDIFVVKKHTSKYFKIDGDIPINSYPYDLNKFNIHYSYIPEGLL